jgi:hypothetical protein
LTPSLSDAYAKIHLGRELLEELVLLAHEVVESHSTTTVVDVGPGQRVAVGEAARAGGTPSGSLAIPDRCRLLARDTAKSLREALDDLVRQLGRLDTGARRRRAPFPIDRSPQEFRRRRRTDLRGLSAAHVAAIERLQPYAGCDWTGPLARLTALDEHDRFVIRTHDYLVNVEGQAASITLRIRPVLRLALHDGLPLIETLDRIGSQATVTLDRFNAEFELASTT